MGALLMNTPAPPQIVAQTDNVAAYKAHKKGLMQRLFPVLDEVPA